MSELNEWYSKFKTFLNILFVRRRKEGWNANDFEKEKLEFIEDHLEDLLPLMSMEEVQRLNIYLHNAYISHLNNGLKIPNNFPQRSFSPDLVILQSDEEHSNQERLEKTSEQSTQDERHETHLPAVDNPETQSHQFESDNLIETHKAGPLSQSTPLSVPFLSHAEPGLLNVQQNEKGSLQDTFISDIVAHISVSPIPIESAPSRGPIKQQHVISPPFVERNAISFLRNFAHIEDEELLHEPPSLKKKTRRRTNKRPISEIVLREPKKKMDKIEFDVLCCYQHKIRTNEQIKRSEESYLHFSLLRGKQTNITSKHNTESDRRHTSLMRVHNLSNVLRAHASQSQISVEQPVQMSRMNLTHSPMTPQGVLRSSISFTPLRGDPSSFEPRMVLDQASSFPTGSLQRQQPLLTIPERDSSIHIPLHPQDEDIFTNDPATFSNLPREDLENVGMLEEELLQIAYNNPSQIEPPSKQTPLNNSNLNIQPFAERESDFPEEIVADQFSNVPGTVPEDFEMIEQPQPPTNPLVIPQQGLVIDIESRQDLNITTGVLTSHLDQVDPMQLQQSSVHPQFSWYEILRPREGLVEYPREIQPIQRKKRKRRKRRRESTDRFVEPRRRYEIPAIISNEDINELPVAPNGDSVQISDSHLSKRPDELNSNTQAEDTNQIIQNHENVDIVDMPENALDTPVQCFEADGLSEQVTQYPIPIETELKEYIELIKRAGRKLEYINWERFDAFLFNESDHFELYTNIFKKIIKDDYVAMNGLHEAGTSRFEAAKAFRFILDLKTMGLIEIESTNGQILGIRLISAINIKKL
ncbi:uncharacterized protein LOC129951453 [Eupeodes corollae]|uniref:uncharacterized protein LOC129951453 n=1 Tax=Eupeodes corollae TaxID=290404 RepID=UPI002493A2C8|nr:uncharacterized protein LOC129951453 [Eupeodes corollae]